MSGKNTMDAHGHAGLTPNRFTAALRAGQAQIGHALPRAGFAFVAGGSDLGLPPQTSSNLAARFKAIAVTTR